MSFFFGGSSKKEVDSVFEILQGKDELQQSNITTLLTFDDSEINGYYKINKSNSIIHNMININNIQMEDYHHD